MSNDVPTARLVERLSKHDKLREVPRAEVEWLATHGELRTYEPGSMVVAKSQPVEDMMIVLTGGIVVHFDHGTGRVHKIHAPAGDLSGLVPFSRMHTAIGDATVVDRTELVAVHRDHFPELIRECPTVTAKLVHGMIDRARVTAATNWQDEKMMSLGRLAAGFAHHLNNPASAALRSAKQVRTAVMAMGDAAHTLGRTRLTEAQHAHVASLLDACLHAPSPCRLTAMERSDREDLIAEWLASRHVDAAPAASLAVCNVTTTMLDTLAQALPADALEPALRWIDAAQTAHMLATDVETASSRMYDLIAGMKRFTSMDRAADAQPLDIAQGLTDTVVVLAGKAMARSVTVHLEIGADLPMVTAHSADLHQVWSNLLENAIDAAPLNGDVHIQASPAPNGVIVCVIDNGAGIAPEVEARMFDPFFTTKDVGEGVGFGLDIVRRIVRMHDGEIAVTTRPGRTEFRVRIPASSTPRR